MSENEKKNEGQSCCCKCWKIIFIAIAAMAIAMQGCTANREKATPFVSSKI